MSKGLNKCCFIGNVGNEIELKETKTGKQYCKLSVAAPQGFGRDDGTYWVRLTAWGKAAEVLAQYAKKGDRLYVEATATLNVFEKDGVKRETTEFHLRDFVLLGGRGHGVTSPTDSDGEELPF
jgi:single-strand DNA-binding protein